MSNTNFAVKLARRPLKQHHFISKIIWPVYAWKAVLPNYYNGKLDVLQNVVLSLAKINRLIDGYVIQQLGISKELIVAVRLSCVEQGYLDHEYKLTKSGELALKESLSFEQSVMTSYEQVFIFRDALTGDVIPNFSVTTLPSDEKVEYDYKFEVPRRQVKAPTFVEIGHALKLRKNLNRFVTTIQNDYSTEEIEVTQLKDMDFADYIEEVHWEDVAENGNVKTMAQVEEEQVELEEGKEQKNNINAIKIISTQPEFMWFEAELYLDPDMPDRLAVNSPFGEYEDDWFTKHLLLHSRQDDRIDETLSLFMEEAKETLMDRFPFNNVLQIDLFEKHPHIANYEKWQPIREAVEAMARAYNRLNEGHEDYDTFYSRAQRLLEAILSVVIQKLPSKNEVMRTVSKSGFRATCERIAENLRIDIPTNLMGTNFYIRLRNVALGKGESSKDRALFLAFDAYRHTDETPSLQLLRNVPDFYDKINRICKVRNVTAHYSEEAMEVSKNYEQIKQEVDFLVDQLIIHYLKAGN